MPCQIRRAGLTARMTVAAVKRRQQNPGLFKDPGAALAELQCEGQAESTGEVTPPDVMPGV